MDKSKAYDNGIWNRNDNNFCWIWSSIPMWNIWVYLDLAFQTLAKNLFISWVDWVTSKYSFECFECLYSEWKLTGSPNCTWRTHRDTVRFISTNCSTWSHHFFPDDLGQLMSTFVFVLFLWSDNISYSVSSNHKQYNPIYFPSHWLPLLPFMLSLSVNQF